MKKKKIEQKRKSRCTTCLNINTVYTCIHVHKLYVVYPPVYNIIQFQIYVYYLQYKMYLQNYTIVRKKTLH